MKKFKLSVLAVVFLTVVSLNVNAQIKVKSTGSVGIGTTNPSADLEIEGEKILFDFTNGSYTPSDIIMESYYNSTHVYPVENNDVYLGKTNNRWYYGYFFKIYSSRIINIDSDIKFKEDITPLSSSLDKVLKLSGVSYKIKKEYHYPLGSKQDKKQIGLIANDVKEIVPEVVDYDSVRDSYSIAYSSLIPVLIEAIKEQNDEIEKLKKSSNSKLKSTEGSPELLVGISSLEQNKPNPFNQETTIEFYLASTINNAMLNVYDLQGKQLKSVDIVQRENGSIVIYANEFQPGMYKYALIADGAIIGTETMILTE